MCPKLRQMTLGRDDEPPVFGVIHAGPSALSREAERPGQVLASRHERRMTSTAGLPSWNLDFFIWKIRQNDHPFFSGCHGDGRTLCRGLSKGYIVKSWGGRQSGLDCDSLRFEIAAVYKPGD